MRSFSLLLGNDISLEDAELIELLEKLPQAMGLKETVHAFVGFP